MICGATAAGAAGAAAAAIESEAGALGAAGAGAGEAIFRSGTATFHFEKDSAFSAVAAETDLLLAARRLRRHG